MKTIGKSLQVIGLVLLPVAMILEISNGLGRSFGVSQMVILLVFGVAVFYIGRIMEGYAHTPS